MESIINKIKQLKSSTNFNLILLETAHTTQCLPFRFLLHTHTHIHSTQTLFMCTPTKAIKQQWERQGKKEREKYKTIQQQDMMTLAIIYQTQKLCSDRQKESKNLHSLSRTHIYIHTVIRNVHSQTK